MSTAPVWTRAEVLAMTDAEFAAANKARSAASAHARKGRMDEIHARHMAEKYGEQPSKESK